MKVTKWETLYHEDHCSILKHKCGKRIVTLSLLSFSLNFFVWASLASLFYLGFFGLSLFCPESHPDLWGNHSLHHPYFTWDNALKNDDHNTFIFLQLNSKLRKKNDSL